MSLAIETSGLTRSYGAVRALEGVDLAVREGGSHAYVGLNGAGKTTTLSILATLVEPTGGSARVFGHDVVSAREKVRGLVGIVSDEGLSCCPDWTPLEYLDYFATMGGRGDAAEALDLVGLPNADRRKPKRALSTGMLRRVEIARALLPKPRVLLLDEPTRGLDLPAKRDMWEWLRLVAREERITIFLSSHEVREIRALCDDLAVIAGGRIVYRGATRSLGHTEEDLEDALVKLLRGGAPEETKFSWVRAR